MNVLQCSLYGVGGNDAVYSQVSQLVKVGGLESWNTGGAAGTGGEGYLAVGGVVGLQSCGQKLGVEHL